MGELIKELAKREGVTITELAKRVKRPITNVSMNLRTDIKVSKFKGYVEALGYKIVIEKEGERIEI